MKKLTVFILENCPFCRRARAWMDELIKENPAFAEIEIEFVDEKIERERAEAMDYYYVPCFFDSEGKKLHEGAASKKIIERIFNKVM